MAGRDGSHGGRRRRTSFWRWFPAVLVLAVLAVAAGAAAYRLDLADRWFDSAPEPDPDESPAAVAPPLGLELPPLVDPDPVADPVDGTLLADPAKVRRVVRPFLRDRDLGRAVHVVVAPLAGGRPYLSEGADPARPASTTKLLTTTAALEALGPDRTFTTSVVRAARGRITLVGGGDPLLGSVPEPRGYPPRADVGTLARETARALVADGIRRVRVGFDDSLFSGPGSGPAFNPHWPDSYRGEVVSPISSLWVDEGRIDPFGNRGDDPARSAAEAFVAALAKRGVKPVGRPERAPASPDAQEIASVESAPVWQLVEHIVETSDNEATEVLLRHVGLETSRRGSFAAGTAAVADTLAGLGVRTPGLELYDGSGLSRDNRIDPDTLIDVVRLVASADHPELRAVLTGLPVGGFTGSLALRFDQVEVPGHVRAKTGTLRGTSSLAGIVTDLDGVPMAFALVADRVRLLDTLDAREALDDLAAALGGCHCAAGR